MKSHIQELLYDYAAGDLSDAERTRVEKHLSGCRTCTADLNSVLRVMEMFPRIAVKPSEERDAAFWMSFANAVDAKIRLGSRRTSFLDHALDSVTSFMTFHRAMVLTGVGSVALLAAIVIQFWPRPVSLETPSTADIRLDSTARFEPAKLRMNDYLKRSKVLLIGLTNMKTDARHPLDLRIERRQSRELVHEARYLKQQPLDMRSARLVADLEKILIELSNIEEDQDVPNVEIIRSGIRSENLIFKIRMAETMMTAVEPERKIQ